MSENLEILMPAHNEAKILPKLIPSIDKNINNSINYSFIICEDGSAFGEEYTLVTVADYVLGKTPGNTVSNLSSTRALRDITNKYNIKFYAISF